MEIKRPQSSWSSSASSALPASLESPWALTATGWLVVRARVVEFPRTVGGSPAAGRRCRFLQNSAPNTCFTKVSHPSFRCYFPIFQTPLTSLLESHEQHAPESVLFHHVQTFRLSKTEVDTFPLIVVESVQEELSFLPPPPALVCFI